MKSGKVIVYALVEPNCGPLRYVGQTTDLINKRLSDHIAHAKKYKKTHVHRWINKLCSQGLKPNIIILDNDAEWNISEMKWIAKLRDAGFNLCNHSDGGDGTLGNKYTQETKDKIAKALKGNKNGLGSTWTPDEAFKEGCRQRNLGEKNPNFGKSRSEETKERIRSSQPNSRKVKCLETGEVFNSLHEAGRAKNISWQNIRAVCEGTRRKTGKLIWSYV